MTVSKLKSLTVRGFRSIELLEGFVPGDVSVLIGANGAGKSNFVEFFRMLRSMADEAFQAYAQTIGPDTLFFHGPKRTPAISARLEFGQNVYEFDLAAKAGGGVIVAGERGQYTGGMGIGKLELIGGVAPESCLKARRSDPASFGAGPGVARHIYDAVSSWTVYHVHDTGPLSPMRGWSSVSNNIRLTHDAGNLAPLLLGLRSTRPDVYERVRDTVRLAAPFIDDFVLRPQKRGTEEQVSLEWTQRGSQEPFQATVLSDGTLRFIALVTALLQPHAPATIVIDEPELGLHPSAIALLSETIRAASVHAQIVVATQSAPLLDGFEPNEVVVVEREVDRSRFRRLDESDLREWLTDYSLGQLWLKNLLGGRPGRD